MPRLALPLLVVLLALPALAASKIRLAAPRCVYINDHQVYPLKGARIEGGTLRCALRVTVPKDVEPQIPARLALRQDGKERAKMEVKVGLSRGTTELELQVEAPEDLNGCMDYELVTRVGDAETVQKFSPSCLD
jgi:hypothetical protein